MTRLGRRRVLTALGGGLVGAGVLANASGSDAFSTLSAPRGTNVSVAGDESNAVVGLDVNSPVKKNSRENLVTVVNNADDDLTVTVSLNDCNQGTLYGPDGGSGCTVTFPVVVGDARTVDIEATVKDATVAFDITASSSNFSLEATRETEAVAGNTDAPTADAGGPYEVDEGQSITLDGTNSANADSYAWEITDGPGSLTDAQTATPEYHAPEVQQDTEATVELTATNNKGVSDSDQATITINDTPSSPPSIDALTVTKTGTKNRSFRVDADVSDDDGDLDRVEITATRTQNGNVEYQNTVDVSGTTDSVSDTTGELGNKKEYEIRIEVFDLVGQSDLEVVTRTTG